MEKKKIFLRKKENMKCECCESRKATWRCPECGYSCCDECHDVTSECGPVLKRIKSKKKSKERIFK
jgi:hypothetical protein